MKIRILFGIVMLLFVLPVNADQPDTVRMKIQYLTQHNDDVRCVAYSPDGKWIATGSWDHQINIYRNDSTLKLHQTLYGHESGVRDLQFSRDSRHIVSGGNDFKVMLWRWSDAIDQFEHEKTMMYHGGTVTGVAYGPALRMVFSCSQEGTIFVYNLSRNKENFIELEGGASCMALGANRQYIYCALNKTEILEMDLRGNIRRRLNGHRDMVNSMVCTPDNRYLVSGSSDKTAIVWDLQKGKPKLVLAGHRWKVTSVAVSLDSKYVITGSNDGTCRIWDLVTGALLDSMHLGDIRISSVAISPDNRNIALGINQEKTDRVDYRALVWNTSLDKRRIAPIQIVYPHHSVPAASRTSTISRSTVPSVRKNTITGSDREEKEKTVILQTDQIEITVEDE